MLKFYLDTRNRKKTITTPLKAMANTDYSKEAPTTSQTTHKYDVRPSISIVHRTSRPNHLNKSFDISI